MAGSNGHRGRLLVGKKEITDYLQIGGPMFYEFIKMGMPARVINSRWYAHTDNLDEYFRVYTRVNSSGVAVEEAE